MNCGIARDRKRDLETVLKDVVCKMEGGGREVGLEINAASKVIYLSNL